MTKIIMSGAAYPIKMKYQHEMVTDEG